MLVGLMNNYFAKPGRSAPEGRNKFNGKAIWGNLFDLEEIKSLISQHESPRVILLFRVIDALELLERDYSKKFILGIMDILGKEDRFVVSFSLGSISGKSKFRARRYWLLDFIEDNFEILNDFESKDERFLIHLGHPEYDAARLVDEYKRDLALGRKDVPVPENVDINQPLNRWRGHCLEFFAQWLKFVYEKTPY